MVIAKRNPTEDEIKKYINEKSKYEIGTKVFWNEERFDDNQIAILIEEFGLGPIEIVGTTTWGDWTEFKSSNGKTNATCSSNLIKL